MTRHDHHLFYCADIVNDNRNDGGDNVITLDENETRHAVSVLRLQVGQNLQVTDGNGAIYDCVCLDVTKRSMLCKIISKNIIPKIKPELTLLVGLPDKINFETILEHAAALGVSKIVPLVMDHCRKPWWQSWEKSCGRFSAIMIAAMKQCLYPYIPTLYAPTSLQKIIDTCDKPIIVADMRGKKIADVDISSHQKLSCLTGPPGGGSSDELKMLSSHNSIIVNISQTRLRTELAATILCAMILRG